MFGKIDKLDLMILDIISKDARIPLSEVAERCGVSRAVVHQRVGKLTEKKAIMGSGYHVNPQMIGYSTCTYVGINLEKGSMYNDVVECLREIPEVVECHFTTGNYTMLIKLYAYDNAHLMDLLNNKIQQIHGVTSTETLISLNQSIMRQLPIIFPKEE
ncbi:MAG: Lrp/AsnC ligand binding domain-containing protein [Bacteroidaceae bacterium]|nr:Lrp/AsnC ligand binding domain-containing protein [Bacteroidaceae bacterium]